MTELSPFASLAVDPKALPDSNALSLLPPAVLLGVVETAGETVRVRADDRVVEVRSVLDHYNPAARRNGPFPFLRLPEAGDVVLIVELDDGSWYLYGKVMTYE